jgi:hypothetical protein
MPAALSKPDILRARTHLTALHAHPIGLDCSLAVSVYPPLPSDVRKEGRAPICRNIKPKTRSPNRRVLALPKMNEATGMESGGPPWAEFRTAS